MIVRKSPLEIERLYASGQLVASILAALREQVRPGISTMHLERLALRLIREARARPAFKGYQIPGERRRFPTALCTSINSEVAHGIPSRRRVLKEGDLLKIDCGVVLDGYYGDSATTVAVGDISAVEQRLLGATRDSLGIALDLAVAGRRVFDIGRAVQAHAEGHGFSIVKDFAGHGIGRRLHEDPVVPNHPDPEVKNVRLRSGMVLAIEPMVAVGKGETRTLRDHFTAVTVDGSKTAHYEHCVAVTRNGPRVLTMV